ncbi:MAG: integrase core domain-containing protein [Kouleothrix sp.]
MDGKGRAHDNIFTSSWRKSQYEGGMSPTTPIPRQARLGIGQYFQFYNTERPHQALNYRPVELYRG